MQRTPLSVTELRAFRYGRTRRLADDSIIEPHPIWTNDADRLTRCGLLQTPKLANQAAYDTHTAADSGRKIFAGSTHRKTKLSKR